jgi:hypothetical protein
VKLQLLSLIKLLPEDVIGPTQFNVAAPVPDVLARIVFLSVTVPDVLRIAGSFGPNAIPVIVRLVSAMLPRPLATAPLGLNAADWVIVALNRLRLPVAELNMADPVLLGA